VEDVVRSDAEAVNPAREPGQQRCETELVCETLRGRLESPRVASLNGLMAKSHQLPNPAPVQEDPEHLACGSLGTIDVAKPAAHSQTACQGDEDPVR
jgi:hypothetical protein